MRYAVSDFHVQWRGLHRESFDLTVRYEEAGSRFSERFCWNYPVRNSDFLYYWSRGTENSRGNDNGPETMMNCLARLKELYEGIPQEKKEQFKKQAIHPLYQFLVEICTQEASRQITKGLELLKQFET